MGAKVINGKEIAKGIREEIKKEVALSVKAVAEKSSDSRLEIQRMFRIIRGTRYLCKVCNDIIKTKSECDVCYR